MADEKKDEGAFTQLFGGLFEKKTDEKPEVGPISVKGLKEFAPVPQPYVMPRFRIRYKGVFDLDGLYKKMVLWLKRRNFEFQERMYKDKPPELEIWWQARRRKTGYLMDVIDAHIHMFDMEKVEIIEKGIKKQRVHARITITLWPTVETGYADIFGDQRWDSAFHRKLMSFYNKYVIRKDLDLTYTDALYYELYNLHAFVKEYLKMEARGNLY